MMATVESNSQRPVALICAIALAMFTAFIVFTVFTARGRQGSAAIDMLVEGVKETGRDGVRCAAENTR